MSNSTTFQVATTEALEAFYRGFSTPFQSFDDDLLEFLLVEHARETIAAFIETHGATLDEREPSVRAFIETSVAVGFTFEAVWSPAFGRVAACALRPDASAATVCDAAVGLAWAFTAAGSLGEWDGETPLREPFNYGEWVFPAASGVAVAADALTLYVTLDDGGQEFDYVLDRRKSLWTSSDGAPALRRNAVADGILILTEGIVESPSHAYLADSVLPSDRVAEAVRVHTAAMALMDAHAPGYAKWVRRLLRAVIPLESKTGGINSGSTREEPGVIHASIDCPIEGYAEMLVHEVGHQYVYVLSRLGSVDDGTDPTLYFSPVKNTGRPIGMILLAYHAFANVILLGRECLRGAAPDEHDYFRQNDAFLRPQVTILEEGLRATHAMTPIGRSLWEPLAAELIVRS